MTAKPYQTVPTDEHDLDVIVDGHRVGHVHGTMSGNTWVYRTERDYPGHRFYITADDAIDALIEATTT